MVCFMCGVCKKEIKKREERGVWSVVCKGCGRRVPVEEKSAILSTARCDCGTTVILEGQGEWSFYPNKTEEEAIKLFLQHLEEKKHGY